VDGAFEAVFAFFVHSKGDHFTPSDRRESRVTVRGLEMKRHDGLGLKHESAGVVRTARDPRRAIALAGGLMLDAVELRQCEGHGTLAGVLLISLTLWRAAVLFPVMEVRSSGVLLVIEEETAVCLATRAMVASAKQALESGRNPGEEADAICWCCHDRWEIAACEKRKQNREIGHGSRME
jgi:hypothetical protein